MLSPPIPENEQQRLEALHDLAILDTPAEERFDRLTRICRQTFGTKMALVSLVDSDRQWFKSRQGLAACETSREISFCGHAILKPEIMVVDDARLDPRFDDNPLVTGPPHIRFYAGAPLATKDGYRIGTLCIIDDQPRQLSEAEQRTLRDLADCVEDEIWGAELQQQRHELRRAKQLTDAIARSQSQFISELDRSKSFNGLLSDLLALTGSEYGLIAEVLYTAEGAPYLKSFAITNIAWDGASRTFYDTYAPQGLEFRNLDNLLGAVITSEKAVIANEPANDPRRGGFPPGHPALKNFLGLPIHHGGALVALFGVANRAGGYDQALIDFLQPLLITTGQLIQAGRLQQENRNNQIKLARLSQVASQTTNGVIITDNKGRVEWINEGLTRLTGHTLDNLCGRKPSELLQESETNTEMVMRINRSLARGEPFNADIAIHTKTGHPCWVQITCNPLRDDSGNLAGFIAILSDIGESKAAAEKIRTTTQLLDSIVENVPSMIFLKRTSDMSFEFMNRTGERILGRSRHELLGHNDYDFFPKEQADFFTGKDRAVLDQEDVIDIAEEEIDTPNGHRTLHTRKLALKDEHGDPRYLLGISEDITEHKRTDRMKNEFVSIVSHELRTPLTAISGALGLIIGGALGKLPDQAHDMIVVAHRNSQRLTYLINDLLDMEKLLAGKMRLNIQPQALMPQIEQAILTNRSYADQYGVHLEVTERIEPVVVAIAPERTQQVLANLLSNATKFSPTGGTVGIAISRVEERVRVEVRDHGPGIPEEFRNTIFQKFAQADASDTRRKGGTGLGLAITKQLVERMGGAIGFESQPGNGATFYFELPLCHEG